MEIKDQLIAEVARIIGLPIIPLSPNGTHDSKPFPHLVQQSDGRLLLGNQVFDPLENGRDFLLVEAWLERKRIRYISEFLPGGVHYYSIDDGHYWAEKTRPLAGSIALIQQFGNTKLVNLFCDQRTIKQVPV